MKKSILYISTVLVLSVFTFSFSGFRNANPTKAKFEDLAVCTVTIKTNVNTSLKMCGTFANLSEYTTCFDFCTEFTDYQSYEAGGTFTANVSQNFSVNSTGFIKVYNPGSSTIVVSVKKCLACSTWWDVSIGAGGFQYFTVSGTGCNTALGYECG